MSTLEIPDPETLPEPPADWHTHHDALVTLTSYLADNGHDGSTVADAVEKPWHYTDEYKLAVWQASR